MEDENLDTTIQEDVETEGTETTEEAPKSARELLMDEIDSKREESVKEDNFKMLGDSGLAPAKEEPAVVIETPKMVKVKVDGEEVEVPYDEVLTNYQKTSAADKRLREAAAERASLDTYRNELLTFQAQLNTKPAEVAAVEATTDPALKEALERAFEGETELAAQQIQKILDAAKAQTSTPVMDEAKMMQAVEQKVAQIQYNSDLNKANILFMEQYKDLNDDEILLELATNQYNKLLTTGVNPIEAVQQAGDATRNWMQSKTGKVETVDTATRQERKQNITTLPQANAKTKSTVNDEPDDISSIISGMRKGRPSTNY